MHALITGIDMAQVNENGIRERLVFASSVLPQKASVQRLLLLVKSIRDFAGSLSQAPFLCFTLDNENDLSVGTKNRLSALNVEFIRVKTKADIPRFPFMRKVNLSAQAESSVQDETDLLAWLDTDTIVLQEPKEFFLQNTKNLGYRPVHHTIIGSRYDDPLDLFWEQIYRYCWVPEDRVFPMTTHVDGIRIRPYFNAGLLVVRPEKRLLQVWRDNFLEIHKAPEFRELLKENARYSVFMHQAVLAGTILSILQTNEIEQLPPTYNYPLHLFWEDVTDHRPSRLEEVVTFRYENFFEDPEWRKRIPAREKLKQWIADRLLP
jgi:hypothetical protein